MRKGLNAPVIAIS